MKKQKIKNLINIFIVILTLSLGVGYIFAWSEPTSNPPSSNVLAPINVNSNEQGIGGTKTTGYILDVHGSLSSQGLLVGGLTQVGGSQVGHVRLSNFTNTEERGLCITGGGTSGLVVDCTAPPSSYTITVNKSGTGATTGSVTSTPGSMTCGATACTVTVTGTATLTATAGSGYVFTGWSGGGCSGTGTCSVVSTSTITATFGSAVIPTMTTASVTGITGPTALGGGTTVSNGGSSVIKAGLVWSTNPNPSLLSYSGKTENGWLVGGPWDSTMTGLLTGQTYYVRAYGTNSVDTGYGNEVPFSTTVVPIVSTTAVTPSSTSATTGGNVTASGGANVTARGVAWSTTSYPTIAGNHTSNGTGTGLFTSAITGLVQNTTYHVRAYATNSEGTSYGDDIQFTTTSNCAGVVVHGYCWYSASLNQNCNSFCANHGGCVNAVLSYTKETAVCQALWSGSNIGAGGGSVSPRYDGNYCYVQGYPVPNPDNTVYENTCSGTPNQYHRNACSCNN